MEETLEIKRPKLLLADDSITIRKVVELTFAEEGVDVFAVGDGEAAMEKFIEVHPDIVLVDVNMPNPDGYHICEMIKQDEQTKDIPVLLLVGSFEPFDTAEAERVGADGFLTKPFQSVRDLVGRVSELLGPENGFAPPPADTTDIEDLYTDSVSETYRAPDAAATDTFLGDAGMDDDLIETSYREGVSELQMLPIGQEPTPGVYDWMAEPALDISEPMTVNGRDKREAEASMEFERVVDDLEDTIEVVGPVAEPQPAEVREAFDDENTSYEPSEEFINIVARRVVDKLSDKAIRDIAREAVPRIVEKLIREALEAEKKG